jgi:hypothetical protein
MKTENDKPAAEKPSTPKPSLAELLNEVNAKIDGLKKSHASHIAAAGKAKKKIFDLTTTRDRLALENHKSQILALGLSLGVPDAATLAVLLEAAKLGGFKLPSAPLSPATVSEKPAQAVSTNLPPPGRPVVNR